jgi:hypothetical protein
MKYIKITAIVLIVLATIFNLYTALRLNAIVNILATMNDYTFTNMRALTEKNPNCKEDCVTGFTQQVVNSINEVQAIINKKK